LVRRDRLLSACWNGSMITGTSSGDMPIPVSVIYLSTPSSV
jgi:hypothetical protein